MRALTKHSLTSRTSVAVDVEENHAVTNGQVFITLVLSMHQNLSSKSRSLSFDWRKGNFARQDLGCLVLDLPQIFSPSTHHGPYLNLDTDVLPKFGLRQISVTKW